MRTYENMTEETNKYKYFLFVHKWKREKKRTHETYPLPHSVEWLKYLIFFCLNEQIGSVLTCLTCIEELTG